MRRRNRRALACLWSAVVCAAAVSAQTTTATVTDLPDTSKVAVWGVHDPSMIKAGDTWYVFSSGRRRNGSQLPIRCSRDLVDWTPCGHVFDAIPAWITAKLPAVQELWAPDVSFEDGEYRLYYAYSLLGKTSSGIALVTNKTLDRTSPDYAWVDHGLVLETKDGDDYNAIDPDLLQDGQNGDWLVFGSFWSGIKLRRLGPDGLPSATDRTLYSIARRKPPSFFTPRPAPGTSMPWQAIEGPILVHHGNFYYLFTSWDHCCVGANSNYHVVVGRSDSVTGPYRDEVGHKLMSGGGTTVLAGDEHWAGPGGQSVYTGPDSQTWLVYHAYDHATGRVSLRLSPIAWENDWPVVQGGP